MTQSMGHSGRIIKPPANQQVLFRAPEKFSANYKLHGYFHFSPSHGKNSITDEVNFIVIYSVNLII